MRIAVVGAGIAGLTAAIALARNGFSVDILERAEALAEIGAGIQLSPNAMAVLDRLGVAADLAPFVAEPEAIEIRDARSGASLARIPLGATARLRYGAPYALIYRGDLQAGLLAAARRQPRIRIQLGKDVEEVTQSENGMVLRSGGDRITADLVVAADGIRSRLRTGLFGGPPAAPLGRTAWRATLPASSLTSALPRDVTRLWIGAGAHLVHYPVQAGSSLNLVLIAAGDSAAASPPLGPFGPAIRPVLETVPDWTRWTLSHVDPTGPWTRGRIVLIGDAAHAMAPSAAQGGAQAIEDAWVLAASLAATPERPEEALQAYERQRRSRVERVAREARRNLLIYDLAGPAAHIRNIAIRALPAKTHLRRLDWLFDWTPA